MRKIRYSGPIEAPSKRYGFRFIRLLVLFCVLGFSYLIGLAWLAYDSTWLR